MCIYFTKSTLTFEAAEVRVKYKFCNKNSSRLSGNFEFIPDDGFLMT